MNITESQVGSVQLPPIVFGTSGLGNLYEEVPYATKLAIVSECVKNTRPITFFDSAGKYGAGLSLESLGKCLAQLEVDPSEVIISNKLGWYRVPLEADEPTFEPGVWKGLKYDAVQRISYDGIKDCFEQGNQLLGSYKAQWVSVHDPDEYLAKARSPEEEERLYQDIMDAYRALKELKEAGEVAAIGVGSKSWEIIARIAKDVQLDWVMIANSLTIHDHPRQLLSFIEELKSKGVAVINSAVFNGGFLVGSDYYNYQPVDRDTEYGRALYEWREKFWAICEKFGVTPAEACFDFGYHIEGVVSIALNTTKPDKVRRNVDMVKKEVPAGFWDDMIAEGLIKTKINHYVRS